MKSFPLSSTIIIIMIILNYVNRSINFEINCEMLKTETPSINAMFLIRCEKKKKILLYIQSF